MAPTETTTGPVDFDQVPLYVVSHRDFRIDPEDLHADVSPASRYLDMLDAGLDTGIVDQAMPFADPDPCATAVFVELARSCMRDTRVMFVFAFVAFAGAAVATSTGDGSPLDDYAGYLYAVTILTLALGAVYWIKALCGRRTTGIREGMAAIAREEADQ